MNNMCENGHHDFRFKEVVQTGTVSKQMYWCKNCPAIMMLDSPVVDEEIPRWRNEKNG